MSLNELTCDQCGQTDDHPKVHSFGGGTQHHDCLSVAEKAELIASAPQTEQIIEAAASGTHGDDLRTFIATLHKEV